MVMQLTSVCPRKVMGSFIYHGFESYRPRSPIVRQEIKHTHIAARVNQLDQVTQPGIPSVDVDEYLLVIPNKNCPALRSM